MSCVILSETGRFGGRKLGDSVVCFHSFTNLQVTLPLILMQILLSDPLFVHFCCFMAC